MATFRHFVGGYLRKLYVDKAELFERRSPNMIEESDGTIHHFDEITIYGGETTMKWDKHAKEPPAVWVETTGALLGITY